MGKQWTAGNEQVTAWNNNSECFCGERYEESPQFSAICFRENSKTRDWTTLAAVKRGRNSPYSSAPASQFSLFIGRVLLEAVRRIGNNSLHVVCRLVVHPLQAVRSIEGVAAVADLTMD